MAEPEPTKTEARLKLEEKAKKEKEKKRRAVSKISREEIAMLDLPEDTSALMTAKELRISGNALLTTEELLSNIPLGYNASDMPLQEAESINLYDFRTLCDIIDEPGRPRQISARTIQGLTQCILSIYRDKGYSGIFVSVPPEALEEGRKLRDEILPINIIEAAVTSVTTNYYTPENEKAEKGYLNPSYLQEWSPIKIGEVGKEKELSNFINLLNLNPDRYISATVSKGTEPDTLAVGYNIYEADPWHYFLQVDNAGTDDRQWSPRVGLINTNLLGIDDRLTVFYQAPWEKGIEERYSIYGSYDFPVIGPRLRLELYAGYSQFDVDGGGGIDFLGHGALYGGKLRYNAFQQDGWFVDLTTSLSHEKSKVSSSIFSAILGSEVEMHLWGVGFDIHRRSDMSNTSLVYDRIQSIGGDPQRKFWDTITSTGARTNADNDFIIQTVAGNHGQYLDPDKIERLSGSVRWIIPDERLVPAKMTTFGGMYSVRGYKESRIIADGGVLASAQYEYDLVKYDQAQGVSRPSSDEKYELKKLAPLVFFDYGRAKITDKVAGEQGDQDLYSVGVGTLVEIGENFSAALYYGYPLESTDTTDEGDGRLNVSLMLRW
jgi:hemolysin activation/secretion protein